MNPEKDIEIKTWSQADGSKIHTILEAAAHTHKREVYSPEWFKWKFQDSPFGASVLCYAETRNGIIAGSVAYGMYDMTVDQQKIKTALAYENFVHPDFQGKGLFTKLIRKVMEETQKQGVDILFVFPNKNALPGYKKLGWQQVNCINFWVRPASLSSVFKFSPALLKKAFKADKVSEINIADKSHVPFLQLNKLKGSQGNWITPHRSKEYLLWRFFTLPIYNYKIIKTDYGTAIIRSGKRGDLKEIQIIEIFPNEKLDYRFLKSILKEIKKSTKSDLITINVSKAHPANNLLYKMFFVPVPNKINFTYFTLNQALKEKVDRADWIFTGTDFHTY